MKLSDYIGMSPFLAFGCWWVFLPRSVVMFYEWFHGAKLREKWAKNPPSTFAVRLVGLFWIVLVVTVTIVTSR